MNFSYARAGRSLPSVVAILGVALFFPGSAMVSAQEAPPKNASPAASTAPADAAPKISGDQLDSLVAPIALFPDPLLAQTLAASTYPLEVIQLQQWLERNKTLKDKALAEAVQKQPWDPSVQAMAAFPDVTKRLAGNIQWTTDLGNAFLAQQSDVMDAVQRMRAKAQSKGALKTSEQQKVETKTEGGKQVIVVQPADPTVVYIPSYDPVVVYGPPVHPYYPYYYPGYVPGAGLAFGTGLVLGAAWGDNWGWGCGWGNGDIDINVNNNYVNHYNKQNINNISGNQIGGGNKWQHRPEHRGNAPYADRRTAEKFGADARHTARDARAGTGGAGNRPGSSGAGTNRPGGGAGAGPGSGIGDSRPSTGNRPSTKPAGGSRDSNSIGNRQVSSSGDFASRGSAGGGSRGGSSRSSSSFGGGGAFDGGSGHQARASSNRGSQSMGGGGMSRGGRGGGRRR